MGWAVSAAEDSLIWHWYGLLVGLILVAMVARRAVLEERVLREELQGYDAYMAQVKYRLIVLGLTILFSGRPLGDQNPPA